jgi:spoIIIJ-associated protein
MESIEVSAKTVDDAILEAAIQLGTTRDKVAYEVITQGSTGFLGIGSKKAVIKAHVKSEEETVASLKAEKEVEKILEKVNEKPVNEKPANTEAPVKAEKAEKAEKPVKAEKTAEPEDVKEFLNKVFAAMNMTVNVTVTENPEEREMNIELEGDDMGVLIGKRGQTLDSLQYLTSLVVNKGSEEYIRVKVDTENYRQRRKETLENLARNISHKVKRTRKPVALEPMNPYERRVIHSALQNDKYVCTHSEGEEPYRRVVVALKEGVRVDNYNNRNRNRYNRNYKNKKEKER